MALDPSEPAQASLVIADDATVRELNAQFRGLDEVTDVLSFSANHPGHWPGNRSWRQTVILSQETRRPFPSQFLTAAHRLWVR